MKRLRFLASFLSLGCLALLTGCGSSGQLRGISVNLDRITPGPNGSATATLRFINENVVPVGISTSKHKVSINGQSLGTLNSQQPLGLPQLTTATQEVTFTLTPAQADLLRKAAPGGAYRIESVLFVSNGEDRLDVKSQGQGTVDLSAMR